MKSEGNDKMKHNFHPTLYPNNLLLLWPKLYSLKILLFTSMKYTKICFNQNLTSVVDGIFYTVNYSGWPNTLTWIESSLKLSEW